MRLPCGRFRPKQKGRLLMSKPKTEQERFQFLQQQELDGAGLYEAVAATTHKQSEGETLLKIAKDEHRHAALFAKYSGVRLKQHKLKVKYHAFLARIFGYTFIIKLLENAEQRSIKAYQELISSYPELKETLADEERHEDELLAILDEERMHYVGDIVLGMNDALVELTGSLAGYTLAMQNTGIIAMAGLITGISATLSMAGSGYLAAREAKQKDAGKSALYTGLSYLITVALLILPYLLFPAGDYLWALLVTLAIAVLVIAAFNYYIAVAKGRPFKRSFLVMAAISLGVAAISFGVGLLVKNVLKINL